MKYRIVRLPLLAAMTALLAASSIAASPFKIHVQPIFQGKLSVGEMNPLRVQIENTGADASGALIVSSGQSRTSYPIELPRGAVKELVVYPNSDFNGAHIALETNQGNLETDARMDNPAADGDRVLMITEDGPGELGFLQTPLSATPANEQQQSLLWDIYSRPGESPNRPVGYEGVSAIVLGPGAERLTDDEVEAIKEWAIAGHTLMFIGGASAPILSDRRWQGVLPAHDFHVAQLANSAVLENLGNQAAPAATITTGILNLGATGRKDGDLLVYAEQPLGLGRAVYLSFNPFDAPLNKWEGKRGALTRLLRVTQNLIAQAYLRGYVEQMGTLDSRAVYSASGVPATSFGSAGSSIEGDPFNTKLPPTGRIFYILAAYFVAVVPLNFLLLKKLKRGELAWVTAPILSFGFAAILFMSAASLYTAKMSTVSDGIVLAQDGGGNGIFLGTTQMFVPRAGSYDLKLKGVDSLASGSAMMPGSAQNADLDPIDRGQITIPDLAANNLSFRKLSYRQIVPSDKWFRVRLFPEIGTRIQCQIANTSPYTLSNAELAFGAISHPLGPIPPGATKMVAVDSKDLKPVSDLPENDVRTFTDRSPRAALEGTLSGFRPGPQLGEDLAGKSTVHFVMFSSWQGVAP